MNMKRRLSATILLVLSLEAALLVAGSPSAAGVVGTIRLPSDAEVTKPARPWKCCNAAICTKSIPPICHCADEVQQCAPTCKDCTASASNPALLVCSDQYIGDPGPICRPWECCDDTVCTRSAPPTCQCLDKVKKCAKTCKNCEKADKSNAASSSRYVCLDRYFGWPGPKCNSGAAGVRLGGN